MRILLQDVRSQLYLYSIGRWTPNPTLAHDFQHSSRLIGFVRDHGLKSVQIAVRFDDAPADEVFPIPGQTTIPTAAAAH